jgi:drug/metabolite transporter (DMT)-like permease
MLPIIFLYMICALTFTVSKATLCYVAPLWYAALRMLIGGCILLAFELYRSKKWIIHKKDILLFVQLALAHITIPYGLELWALSHGVSSIASSVIFNLSPFIAALLSYWWFGEQLTKYKIIGLTLGSIAFIFLLVQQCSCQLCSFNIAILPILAILGAVIASSYGWILVKDLVSTRNYTSGFVNGCAMGCGGLFLTCASYISGEWKSGMPVYNIGSFIVLLALIIILSNLFYVFYGYLLKTYSATFLSFAGFTTPIMVTLLSVLFLTECFSWLFIPAIVLTGLGIWLFYREELKTIYHKHQLDKTN